MQTFLPYADFRTSLDCLENKRLGKQRVEAMQLINVLTLMSGQSTSSAKMNTSYELGGLAYGWSRHPAAKMWVGYIPALKLYHDIAIRTWKDRGFKNNRISTLRLFV